MKLKGIKLLSLAAIGVLTAFSQQAFATPSTTHTENFLVIATGDGSNGDVFDMDGGELGANQEVVASGVEESNGMHDSFEKASGLDLRGEFHDGNWVDYDATDGGTVGISDYLKKAKILRETPDYTGNVAIVDEDGTFTTENTDYFASIGIKCNQSINKCGENNDFNDDSWKQSDGDSFVNLEEGQGVSEFGAGEAQAIIDELGFWHTYINSLDAEYTITNKDIQSDYFLDIDKIDSNTAFADSNGEFCDVNKAGCSAGNNDGIAVIDIDVGDNDFLFQNADWILQTTGATTAIFRMINTKTVKFDNASVMMGCSDKDLDHCLDDQGNEEYVTDLGAMFFTDNASSHAFDLSNVILGGIGLWDLGDSGDGIVTNNFQGCTQLISNTVTLSSKSRLNRCSLSPNGPDPQTTVPEPTTLALFGTLLILLARRQYFTK